MFPAVPDGLTLVSTSDTQAENKEKQKIYGLSPNRFRSYESARRFMEIIFVGSHMTYIIKK